MSFTRPDNRRRQISGRARCTALVAAGTALFGLLLLPALAAAGTIHPAVADQLARLAPGEEATVIVMLEQQAEIPALNQALKVEGVTRQERHRRVVEALQETARSTQGPLVAKLEEMERQGAISGYTPYWIANLVVVRGTREAIESLGGRADVGLVESNFQPELVEPVSKGEIVSGDHERGIGVAPGIRAVRAPEVWHELGINGAGALVANQDTGVDGNHPALRTRWRGYNGQHPWQECWLDVLGGGDQSPTDYGSHGTHVMGTITGLGEGTQDSIGVAWGAQWIACNSINQGVGSGFDSDVIQCFQWLADPDGNPNTIDDVPDVVQNSWRINEGFGGNYTDCDTRWWAVIDNCEAAGVVVVFSAGNEGPGAQTIGSPPDRATNAYNVFSVGAVDATNYNWPYPIAGFSSRGPTGCNVPPELRIKPEICGPGVDVYSSVPGGGYQGGWSGTSMSGPHVAGVVGLMRAANPDLDAETIKQIIFDTARDEGSSGEDNTYGWGFIDAYEAVLRAMTGFGTISGEIANQSNGGTGVPLARVRLVEINRAFVADNGGAYSGLAPQGTYSVEVTHPSFETVVVPDVVIVEDQVTDLDVALTDIGAPEISEVQYPHSVQNPDNPLIIEATITDFSALATTECLWRVDGGEFNSAPLTLVEGNRYQASLPGQPIGALVEFYLHAVDAAGNAAVSPVDAPNSLYEIYVVLDFFSDNVETDRGWTLSLPNDTGAGRWVRVDPYGTTYQGNQIEPADDHTPSPGTLCFVTGQGTEGGSAGLSDVDGGCVHLTSPAMDLSQAAEAIVSYWRWFAVAGPSDANFNAQVTSNGGLTWVPLESLTTSANTWTQRTFDLRDIVRFTNQVRFRFVACDTGSESLVEAAIDDFALEGVPGVSGASDPRPAARTILYTNRPNPFSAETHIGFRLASAGPAELAIYDPAGRQVRSLISGPLSAGEHAVVWDGKDTQGHAVNAGIYFYELKTEGYTSQRKMLLVK